MGKVSNEIAYMSVPGGGLGTEATDWPLARIENAHCSVTETWWWCIHLPELNMNAEVYFWKHSNLNTMSGGVWVYQGIKKHHLQCEHFNWKNYLPAPERTGSSLFAAELDLRINILEPMKKHEVIYKDRATDTSLYFMAESVQPPAIRANNAHFEQAQRLKGVLRLNGNDIQFDCLSMRDRSWGEPRPELAVIHPPTLWAVGISQDARLSFNFNACDDPTRNPLVAQYGLSQDDAFKVGWMYRDGEFRCLKSVSKCTERGSDGLQSLRYDVEMADDRGQSYQLRGEVLASVFWSPWPNMAAFFGQLTRWHLDGELMYGETQEVLWGDCIKRMIR
jgi:hypothetical protein